MTTTIFTKNQSPIQQQSINLFILQSTYSHIPPPSKRNMASYSIYIQIKLYNHNVLFHICE